MSTKIPYPNLNFKQVLSDTAKPMVDATSIIEHMPTHQLCLRLYDVDVQITSDSERYLHHVRSLYERFLVEPDSLKSPMQFVFMTSRDNPWNSPVFVVDQQVWHLDAPIPPEEYIYSRISSTIISRIQSHMMIHAGMVANGERGLMVVADSYHGKTTLVLEMVRRGFQYLSDDMAAIDRTTGLVHPFPTRIGLRPGTWSLVMGSAPLPDSFAGSQKSLLDCEQFRPGSMGKPVRCEHIVFLKSPLSTDRLTRSQASQRSIVVLDRVPDDLLRAIQEIDDIDRLTVDVRGGITVLTLEAQNMTLALSKIETACGAHDALILYIHKGLKDKPAFDSPVHLCPIPKREAALGLLKKFQGGYTSQILQTTLNDNPVRLLMELTSFVEPLNCYQLSVGPLGDMADHLCRLMDR